MRDGVTLQLVGDRELIRKLEAIEKRHGKSAIRKGLRAGVKILTAEAKRTAPRRTGALAKAIKTRAGPRSRSSISVATRLGAGFFKGETFYGGFQEFGWRTGKRGSSRRRAVPGRHFLEKAAKRVGPAAGKVALERIRFEIEQAARA